MQLCAEPKTWGQPTVFRFDTKTGYLGKPFSDGKDFFRSCYILFHLPVSVFFHHQKIHSCLGKPFSYRGVLMLRDIKSYNEKYTLQVAHAS